MASEVLVYVVRTTQYAIHITYYAPTDIHISSYITHK